ncbi:MAG TPA: M20/M25/M40 family metallo-hydrolase, partial [Candidatus Dormibacteraeota bacterium]|nr:M20/M25/M40 family metallo-hydrolase [Candidatus Dormibacteraeota bacterium]
RLALEVRRLARDEGGVGTVGRMTAAPGIPTAVAGWCELTLDQRHLDPDGLERMLTGAREAGRRIAAEEGVEVEWERIWRIDPIPFHPELLDRCERAVREVAGTAHRLPSGPLHDAAEVARAGVPTAMLFVQSLGGLSHTREEDTRVEHLELAVRALDRAADLALEWADR